MTDMHYKYLVALSDSTFAEDLEALLNEKASDGWELFMLHEVDNRMGKTQYNCIFYKLDDDMASDSGENVEVSDITDFKKRIEKIYQTKDTHKDYIELQKRITNLQKEISSTKEMLDTSEQEKERKELNSQIEEKLNELKDLNLEMAKISDSFKFYNRIKSDKITIYLSDELTRMAENDNDENLIAKIIHYRQDLTDKQGFVIPNIRYTDDLNLEPYQYKIHIREVPAASGFVYPGHRMFFKGQNNLTRKPRNAISALHPLYLFDVFWLKEEQTKDFWEEGLSPSDLIATHLAYTCIKHSNELLDYKDINNYLDIARKNNFELVENLIPEIISPGDLRYIIACLIREMVPVKDINFIFERIMDLYNYTSEKEILLEKLRITMKRQISYSRSDENNQIEVILVDPELDKYLKDNIIIPEHSNPFLNLSKEETEQLMNTTAGMIESTGSRIEHTAILCSNSVRQPLFFLFEEFIPGIAVLSHEEIDNEIEMSEIGTLSRKKLLTRRSKKR
jgi:flagellar biosynthesis protein FlhA